VALAAAVCGAGAFCGIGAAMKLALAGLVILIIGDSHLAAKDFLLASLHNDLEAQGASVQSYGVCGSSPQDWVVASTLPCGRGERHDTEDPVIEPGNAKVWSLEELIGRHRPDLLIVELGDNMGGYGVLPELPRDWVDQQVHQLLVPIKADRLPCLWVGPPWGTEGGASKKTFARVEELSHELATVVAPCHYVDSLKFSEPGAWQTFDGEHLKPDSYQVWGDDITGAVVRFAAHLRRHPH
jgi:hypothetical protein